MRDLIFLMKIKKEFRKIDKYYDEVEKTYNELVDREILYMIKKDYFINKTNIYNSCLKDSIINILSEMNRSEIISIDDLIERVPIVAKEIHDAEFSKYNIPTPDFSINVDDCVYFIKKFIANWLIKGRYNDETRIYTSVFSKQFLNLRKIFSDYEEIEKRKSYGNWYDYFEEELITDIDIMESIFPDIFELFHTYSEFINKDLIKFGSIKFKFSVLRELLNLVMILLQADIKLSDKLILLDFLLEISVSFEDDKNDWQQLNDLIDKSKYWILKLKIIFVLYNGRFMLITKEEIHEPIITSLYEAVTNKQINQQEKQYLIPFLLNLYRKYRNSRVAIYYYLPNLTSRDYRFTFEDFSNILETIRMLDSNKYKEILLETVNDFPEYDELIYLADAKGTASQLRILAMNSLYKLKEEKIFNILKNNFFNDPSKDARNRSKELICELRELGTSEFDPLITLIILMDDFDFYGNWLYEEFFEKFDLLDTIKNRINFFYRLIEFLIGFDEKDIIEKFMYILDKKNDLELFQSLYTAIELRYSNDFPDIEKLLQCYIKILDQNIELDEIFVKENYSIVFNYNNFEIKSKFVTYLVNKTKTAVEILSEIQQSFGKTQEGGGKSIKDIQLAVILLKILKEFPNDKYEIIDFILTKQRRILNEESVRNEVINALSNLSEEVFLEKLMLFKEKFKEDDDSRIERIDILLKAKKYENHIIPILVFVFTMDNLEEYELKGLINGLKDKNKELTIQIMKEAIKKDEYMNNFNLNYGFAFLAGLNSLGAKNMKRMIRTEILSEYEISRFESLVRSIHNKDQYLN